MVSPDKHLIWERLRMPEFASNKHLLHSTQSGAKLSLQTQKTTMATKTNKAVRMSSSFPGARRVKTHMFKPFLRC